MIPESSSSRNGQVPASLLRGKGFFCRIIHDYFPKPKRKEQEMPDRQALRKPRPGEIMVVLFFYLMSLDLRKRRKSG